MANDDDLIRRGDALAIVERGEFVYQNIAALPPVTTAPDAYCWPCHYAGSCAKHPPAPAEDAKAKGETDGQMLERLGMDGAKWAAEFRTTALRLGYSDMDEGWLIGWFANAIMAGYDRKPAPDAAAIREAALREAAAVVDAELMRWGFPPSDGSRRDEMHTAILALITEKPHDRA